MLKDCDFKIRYSSEKESIYDKFYVPALSNAITYKRAVGFFSLGIIFNTTAALSYLVENKGQIKIIFGKLISQRDLAQIQEGLEYDFSDELPNFKDLIIEHSGTLVEYRVRLLAYLFKTGQLQMMVALRRNGLFHQKIGIIEDAAGDCISFNGSMNETLSALDPDINSEEITVFKSWKSGQDDYVDQHNEDFENLWSNSSSENTIVCNLPEVLREEINIIASDQSFIPSVAEEKRLLNEFLNKNKQVNRITPTVPSEINGNIFEIRPHQKQALTSWQNSNYQGILELATGTGKTITSIYGLTKIAENIPGISAVISVPYLDLAEQWVEQLGMFNIFAIKCYGSRVEWQPKVKEYLLRNQPRQTEFITLVVVNKTFKSDAFQAVLRSFDCEKLFLIGDECHHHMSKSYENRLPLDAKFRLGLSATPFHYLDEEGNERLRAFYGNVVYKYTLYEAIENGILSKYEYNPIPVTLTPEETEEYFDLSEKIGRLIASRGINNSKSDEQLQSFLMRRARLIGTASNKLRELNKLISANSVQQHSLFYCSDGKVFDEDSEVSGQTDDAVEVKQRVAVGKLLKSNGVRASFFTADESRSQRSSILTNFKNGDINALVAIKCLDEGIDVPACSTAYILASSRNPRQFIQRRGRILRKSPGKDKAIIYDFIVVLPEGSIDEVEKESDFFKRELERVADFAKHSSNHLSSLNALDFWLEKYDLHHLVI